MTEIDKALITLFLRATIVGSIAFALSLLLSEMLK